MALVLDKSLLRDPERASHLEWLETNGLGGFASSTAIGANTRRYHGLLCAALIPPVRRHLLLSRVEETLETPDGRTTELGCNFYPETMHPRGFEWQVGFRLDPFPVFTWEAGEHRLEKTVFLVQGEDTVVLRYALLCGGPCRLTLRPFLAFRDYHSLTRENDALDRSVRIGEGRVSVQPYPSLPVLHFFHRAREPITARGDWWRRHVYPRERERGLDFEEDLFSPFQVRFALKSGRSVLLVASTREQLSGEAEELEGAERARRTRTTPSAPALPEPLAAAAEAFRVQRADGSPTVIAGYPWFTDWGRDTMISLPGLTLALGRADQAREILLSFARHLSGGMIPNRFPDSGEAPEYNNVDGTLWFAHAIGRYLESTGDRDNAERVFVPLLLEVVRAHREGTRYGIRVDADGLLRAGEPGVQLTWMDAKVGEWVVTPRIGKPVEVNALWIETLETAEAACTMVGRDTEATTLGLLASQARAAFARRFWNESGRCLYDVVDGPEGDDPSIRPNQILALAFPNPLLSGEKAKAVLETVERELLTPYGLRTLSPKDPRFAPRYQGDPRARDGAYHQGTVWPWLMGPFVRAWLSVHGRTPQSLEEARGFLKPLLNHLTTEECLGQVSEIFDATPPHAPRGCFAQAWSVAELIALLTVDLV